MKIHQIKIYIIVFLFTIMSVVAAQEKPNIILVFMDNFG